MEFGCGPAPVANWLLPLLGAPFIGSLLGVLIERVPAGRPVLLARSACDSCGNALGARDLIPLLSFMASRGRCRQCGSAIPAFNLIFELAAFAVAAVAVGAAAITSGFCLDGGIWVDCGLGWTLLALAWIDYRHMSLPDALTLPLLVAGLCVTYLTTPEDAPGHAVAAAAGYGAFRLISFAYARLRGREGLGAGDAKLLAAGGAWLGSAALAYVVLTAASLGIVLVLAAAHGRTITRTTAIPFGPCLAAAIFGIWLYCRDVLPFGL